MNFILGNTSINETSRIIFITELDYLCYLCPEPTCFPKAGCFAERRNPENFRSWYHGLRPDHGESLYRYQDEKLYRPASIEKVITSVTALARLGADYTMDTHLRYTGKIENDTLKGNLYLIGGFDPELMDEDLDSLVAAVEAQGIRYVTDTIAADVSMMDSVYWGPRGGRGMILLIHSSLIFLL